MVMPSLDLPGQRPLDILTRIDELLVKNIEANQRLVDILESTLLNTGLNGNGLKEAFSHIANDFGQPWTKTLDITAAHTDTEVTFPPCKYLQFKSDGKHDGITVKIQNQSGPALSIDDYSLLPVNDCDRIYVTNTAVTGRTELRIYATRYYPLGEYVRGASGIFGSELTDHYYAGSTRSIAVPLDATAYTLPETGSIDCRSLKDITFYIAKATNKPAEVIVQHSYDNSTFYDLVGFEIATADFELTNLNSIYVPLNGYYFKLKVTTGATGAGQLDMWHIAKA